MEALRVGSSAKGCRTLTAEVTSGIITRGVPRCSLLVYLSKARYCSYLRPTDSREEAPPPRSIVGVEASGHIEDPLQIQMMRMIATLAEVVEASLFGTLARLSLVDALSLLAMGAAVSGRCTRRTGAQPRSCTHAPMPPARAAVGAAGSGGLWPRPRWRRPSPRGHRSRRWWTLAAVLRSAMVSGHCRWYRAAEASSQEAVGRVGVEGLGFRLPRAAVAAQAMLSSGMRTRAVAPLSPFPGCCRRYRATDASGLEAVGRFGVGLLGAGREAVAAALLADVFLAVPLGTTMVPPTISGSCSLYHAAEALLRRAVGGGGGGMLGPRREVIAATVTVKSVSIGIRVTTR